MDPPTDPKNWNRSSLMTQTEHQQLTIFWILLYFLQKITKVTGIAALSSKAPDI